MKKIGIRYRKKSYLGDRSNQLFLVSGLLFLAAGLVRHHQNELKEEAAKKTKAISLSKIDNRLKKDSPQQTIPSRVSTASLLWNSTKEFSKQHYGKGLIALGFFSLAYFIYSTRKYDETGKRLKYFSGQLYKIAEGGLTNSHKEYLHKEKKELIRHFKEQIKAGKLNSSNLLGNIKQELKIFNDFAHDSADPNSIGYLIAKNGYLLYSISVKEQTHKALAQDLKERLKGTFVSPKQLEEKEVLIKQKKAHEREIACLIKEREELEEKRKKEKEEAEAREEKAENEGEPEIQDSASVQSLLNYQGNGSESSSILGIDEQFDPVLAQELRGGEIQSSYDLPLPPAYLNYYRQPEEARKAFMDDNINSALINRQQYLAKGKNHFIYEQNQKAKKLKEKKKETEKARLENIKNNPSTIEEEKLVKTLADYLVAIVFKVVERTDITSSNSFLPIIQLLVSPLLYEEGFRRSLLNNLFSLLQHMKERDSKKWMKWTISSHDVAKEIADFILDDIVFNYVTPEEWEGSSYSLNKGRFGKEDIIASIKNDPVFMNYVLGKSISLEDLQTGLNMIEMKKNLITIYEAKVREIVDSFNEEEGAYYQKILKWDRRTRVFTYHMRTSLEVAKEVKNLKKAFEIIESDQILTNTYELNLKEYSKQRSSQINDVLCKKIKIPFTINNRTIYDLHLNHRKPINPQPQSSTSANTNNINNQNNNNNNIRNQNQDNTQHLNLSPQNSAHNSNHQSDNHSNHSHNSNHTHHIVTPAPSPQLEEF